MRCELPLPTRDLGASSSGVRGTEVKQSFTVCQMRLNDRISDERRTKPEADETGWRKCYLEKRDDVLFTAIIRITEPSIIMNIHTDRLMK